MIPIVLHHGIFGSPKITLGKFKLCNFAGDIVPAIAGRGHPVIVSKVHPTAGIATRAAELKTIILRQLDQLGRADDGVVIIAHSMGGLDARFMISRLDMAHRVRALVTISTPHRGDSYADWWKGHLGRLGGFEMVKWMGINIQAVNDLTLESCRRFNDAVLDAPEVRYFSINASRPWHKVPPFALHPWRVVHEAEGENDGMVSASSAIWGEHIGTWPVDHWHQVNKRFVIERNGIGDVAPLYLKLLDQLAEAGVVLDDAGIGRARNSARRAGAYATA